MGSTDNLRVMGTLLPAFLLMGLETLLTVHVVRLLVSFASGVAFPSLTTTTVATRVDVAVCAWQLINYLVSPLVCYLKAYFILILYSSTADPNWR